MDGITDCTMFAIFGKNDIYYLKQQDNLKQFDI